MSGSSPSSGTSSNNVRIDDEQREEQHEQVGGVRRAAVGRPRRGPCPEEKADDPDNELVVLSPTSAALRSVVMTTRHLPHPYLQVVSPRHSRTLLSIQRSERRIIQLLQRRSGWKVYPRGPARCYTIYDNTTTTTAAAAMAAAAAAAVVLPAPGEEDNDDDDDYEEEDVAAQNGRIVTLTLNDLTVYALLQVLDNYLSVSRQEGRDDTNHGPQPRPRPTVPQQPPAWHMPEDIAVLDQLRHMELYNCTGVLPESMNYLWQLQSLKLRSCHGLQLHHLRHMTYLKELEVTDSEGVLPSTFANLARLEHLKLYRMESSEANTNSLGRDWIRDLNEHTMAWSNSLKDLCFCSAGLENEDFATLMVDILAADDNNNSNHSKFPSLRSIVIISNPNITSFQPLLDRWEQKYCCEKNNKNNNMMISNVGSVAVVGNGATTSSTTTTLASTAASNTTTNTTTTNHHHHTPFLFLPPPLRVLSLTGTIIAKTVPEMQAIAKFLQLYHEIGLFMTVSIPPTLTKDVVQSIKMINHQVTLNRAGGPVLLTCEKQQQQQREIGHDTTQHQPLLGGVGGGVAQGEGPLDTNANQPSSTPTEQDQIPSSHPPPLQPTASLSFLENNNNNRRRPLPLSMWPLVLERAMNLDYVACYETATAAAALRYSYEADRRRRRRWTTATNHHQYHHPNHRPGAASAANADYMRRRTELRRRMAQSEAVMRRVDRVVARARAILGGVHNNQNNNNDINNGNNDGGGAPHVVVANPPVVEDPHNDDDDDDTNNDNFLMVTDHWMENPTEFADRAKYDAVYHLLRNGPVLLATGNKTPNCRRKRSYIARKCKRIKLF